MTSHRTKRGAGNVLRTVTPALVRDALDCIPADVDRDTWARLAMAIKAELGDGGFDMWDAWSRQGSTYDESAAKSTWRSIQGGGGVAIGTLFGIAKHHGFSFPKDDAAAAPVDPAAAQAEAERMARERKERNEAEAAELAQRREQSAQRCATLWEGASDAMPASGCPYLTRKGVGAHGLRFLPGGTAVVPMRDIDGRLWSVQRLLPKPLRDRKTGQAGTDKLYGPPKEQPDEKVSSRKLGLFHVIGNIEGAELLLLAEGYATAATLHEATGMPVVVCFDSGNLVHVAKALRQRYPGLRMLVCGDDDRATEARTGKNPGRDKARAAAAAAGGTWVLPQGLPDDCSDFNDLAAHAGLQAVRDHVEAALRSDAPPPAASAPAKRARSSAANPPQQEAPHGHDPFAVNDEGVWFVARDAEGNEKRPVWLCSRLDVTARTRADDTNGWGCLLEFSDPDGNAKTWAMPSSMLSGDGGEWAGRLRDMGLKMAPGVKARNLVAQYIDTRNPVERAVCTDRVGWHGPVFVLPSGSIGTAEGRRYVFQSESGMEDTYRRHGDLADWQREVARLCVGNSRLLFAVSCAFAGPMLRLAGMESGGFHLRGESSMGKTTALRVAASVWGRPSYMQRWRTTDNALEATAVQHCDSLLILDEFGQLDPRVAGDVAYMLANDQEKGRATRGGLARRRRTWRLLFLSSGEVSLADHMAEAGKRTRAGQEVRMVDVPLDAGVGMGGLECLHGAEGPGALADAVVAAAGRLYGTAGRLWLEWASAHHGELPGRLEVLVARYRAEFVPEASSEQVRRAGGRFALVAAAGELASQAGITGWESGEAARGVRLCFNAWLAARGHLDNGEDVAMLRQVRRFLELNGEGRFTWWHRAGDDRAPKTLNRAGFRRMVGTDGRPIKTDADHLREYGDTISARDLEQVQVEYFVLREVFKQEVCSGYDHDAVAHLLDVRGHLVRDKDRLQVKPRLPGIGLARCYQIRPSIFEDDL